MRKGWVYNKKTGSWKKEHQSKISDKKLVYDPKTGFAKGSSKKKTKSKEPSPEDRDYVLKELRRREKKLKEEEKTDTKKDRKNLLDHTVIPGGHDTSPTSAGQLIGGIAIFAIFAVILFSIFNAIDKADPIDKAIGFFDDRSDKKERCADRADSASTSYAAKKIYKACMSN